MPFYQIGTLGLLLAQAGVYSADLSGVPAPPPPPPEGLSPSWLVEYVDTSGVRQRTTVASDGSTSITVRQYANLTFDGRATRSTSTGCDTAAGAAQLMGYGINYGEALGGTWSTSGLSNDTDIGPPIFSRCYTVTGARTVTLYVRDPDAREHALTLTVNVQTLGSVVDISSGGSWPTWASNTVYGLASGDYTSRGAIETDGLYGIRIIKTGGGSNPVVGSFQPDSRGISHGSVITTRSADVVLVNVDYSAYADGLVGSDYCGSYGGHCAHFGTGRNYPREYAWDNEAIAAANSTNAANIRWSRGTFVVNGGSVNGAGGLTEYALIGGERSMNFCGTTFARTTGTTGGNPMRTYMDSTVLRHIQVYSTTSTFHFIKGSVLPNVYAATPSNPWPSDDSYGDYATSRALYLANGAGGAGIWGVGPSYFWICDNLFGGPGTVDPTFIASWGPQNSNVPTNGLTGPWFSEDCYESASIGGIERNRMTYNSGSSWPIGGRDLSWRDNLQLSGASGNYSNNYNDPKTHPDYRGPYITSARPVHSALA